MKDLLAVPPHRVTQLESIRDALLAHERIILTTHVNADGDGAGSEAAVLAWLKTRGKTVHIANPTAFPDSYKFLIEDTRVILDPGDPRTFEELQRADAVLVLDTGEPKRIGRIASSLSGKSVMVIDHHQPSDVGFTGTLVVDTSACATGELVYDLMTLTDLRQPWPALVNEGIYTAIVTDTGSFRFSNTSPRAHVIAGQMIAAGVDPELAYKRLFGTVPLRRIQLLRHALDSLEVDEEAGLAWISIPRELMEESGAGSEDLEGVVEHARSIQGTEVAILFRETADGATKVSLRSTGEIDVNAIARAFGGGGHIKASGAVLPDRLPRARERVLEAARAAIARNRRAGK